LGGKKRKSMWGVEKNKKQTCGESYSTFLTRFRVLLIVIVIEAFQGWSDQEIGSWIIQVDQDQSEKIKITFKILIFHMKKLRSNSCGYRL
jgi:hypothetical protein